MYIVWSLVRRRVTRSLTRLQTMYNVLKYSKILSNGALRLRCGCVYFFNLLKTSTVHDILHMKASQVHNRQDLNKPQYFRIVSCLTFVSHSWISTRVCGGVSKLINSKFRVVKGLRKIISTGEHLRTLCSLNILHVQYWSLLN